LQNISTNEYDNTMDKLSYALGLSFGQQIASANLPLNDKQSFVKGIETILNGTKPEIDFAACQEVLNDFFAKVQEEENKQNATAKKEGEEFLAKNRERTGINTTASGLQYEVIKEGKGDKPSTNDTVEVHYHGTLIDGTVFDSSVKRGQPAVFGVNQVIKGWVEGLQLMSVGSKYRFYIPSELAYGEHGAGSMIKPHSTLIFEVELLGIKK